MDNRDRQQWDHRRTASKYASTAALVRHHAETLLAAHQPPPKPPEPTPDPADLTRCPCHGQWTSGECRIPVVPEPVPAEPEPARCECCGQELPPMMYGPNTYVPEPHEAEKDEHETAQAQGQCSFTNPCPACERSWKR